MSNNPDNADVCVYVSEGFKSGFVKMTLEKDQIIAHPREQKEKEVRFEFPNIGTIIFLPISTVTIPTNNFCFPDAVQDRYGLIHWYRIPRKDDVPEEVCKDVTGHAQWEAVHEQTKYSGTAPLTPREFVLLKTGVISSTPSTERILKTLRAIVGVESFSRLQACANEYDSRIPFTSIVCANPNCSSFPLYPYSSQQHIPESDRILDLSIHSVCFACGAVKVEILK